MSKLYFGYGMNTNIEEMSYRCPKAINCGHAVIKHYRLAFRGVADFEHAENFNLHGVLWLITPECEIALDRLEGYPTLYDKLYMTAKVKKANLHSVPENIELPIMIYQMHDRSYRQPNESYYNTLKKGYKRNNLPTKQLLKAKIFAVQNQKNYLNTWEVK
jgi:hypothetical protein|tara:strand:+ start:1820 stop:2299 length:480 start_codon:yes stop_codon:yes gene_type:complete